MARLGIFPCSLVSVISMTQLFEGVVRDPQSHVAQLVDMGAGVGELDAGNDRFVQGCPWLITLTLLLFKSQLCLYLKFLKFIIILSPDI